MLDYSVRAESAAGDVRNALQLLADHKEMGIGHAWFSIENLQGVRRRLLAALAKLESRGVPGPTMSDDAASRRELVPSVDHDSSIELIVNERTLRRALMSAEWEVGQLKGLLQRAPSWAEIHAALNAFNGPPTGPEESAMNAALMGFLDGRCREGNA